MSEKPWQESLRQTVNQQRLTNVMPRIAVVGIGHDLRGDDGAGNALARILNRQVQGQSLLVIAAGPAPENLCGLLRRFAPHLVLLIDAAQMAARPGTICQLNWQDMIAWCLSTHTLPLHTFCAYLVNELGCEVALLGIQPESLRDEEKLSPVIQQAVEAAASDLAGILWNEIGEVVR